MTMQREALSTIDEQPHGSITLRDVTAVLFRQRRLLTLSFVGILLLAVVLSGATVALISSGDEDSSAARTHGSRCDLAVEQPANR